jgi:hypothetical protein
VHLPVRPVEVGLAAVEQVQVPLAPSATRGSTPGPPKTLRQLLGGWSPRPSRKTYRRRAADAGSASACWNHACSAEVWFGTTSTMHAQALAVRVGEQPVERREVAEDRVDVVVHRHVVAVVVHRRRVERASARRRRRRARRRAAGGCGCPRGRPPRRRRCRRRTARTPGRRRRPATTRAACARTLPAHGSRAAADRAAVVGRQRAVRGQLVTLQPLDHQARSIATNSGSVPTVADRLAVKPSRSATCCCACRSRSYSTSTWSLVKPIGTITASRTPAACSASRWSPTSGSSHGHLRRAAAGLEDEVPRPVAAEPRHHAGGGLAQRRLVGVRHVRRTAAVRHRRRDRVGGEDEPRPGAGTWPATLRAIGDRKPSSAQ